MSSVRSGAPVFTTDSRLRVDEWNRAAEAFTGIAAAEAVGRPCWFVIGGRDGRGRALCRAGCSVARTIAGGWEVEARDVAVDFPSGRTAVTLSTVVVETDAGTRVLHQLHDLRRDGETPSEEMLTGRQLEILNLLAGGVRVREIARRLVLAEATVRNHVHAILVELGAHSQLEAVARGRALGLIEEPGPVAPRPRHLRAASFPVLGGPEAAA